MEIKDLKNGMVLRLRNNNLYLLLSDTILYDPKTYDMYNTLINYNDELKYLSDKRNELDIMEVYRGVDVLRGDCEPIWKRDEEFPCEFGERVKVRNSVDDEWTSAKYIKYYPRTNYQHCVLTDKNEVLSFKKCRRLKDVKVGFDVNKMEEVIDYLSDWCADKPCDIPCVDCHASCIESMIKDGVI